MPRKKKETVKKPEVDPNVFGLRAETVEQPITETLETNLEGRKAHIAEHGAEFLDSADLS